MLNKKTLGKLAYMKKDRNEKASLFGREAFLVIINNYID
jgi:hypothetical protein